MGGMCWVEVCCVVGVENLSWNWYVGGYMVIRKWWLWFRECFWVGKGSVCELLCLYISVINYLLLMKFF